MRDVRSQLSPKAWTDNVRVLNKPLLIIYKCPHDIVYRTVTAWLFIELVQQAWFIARMAFGAGTALMTVFNRPWEACLPKGEERVAS